MILSLTLSFVSNAILQGSLIGYSAGSSSSSKDSSGSIPKLAIATPESTGIPALPADFWRRCICLANIAGVVIAASSLYNPNTNKGQLVIRALGGLKKPRGSEITEKKKKLRKERERLELERKMAKKARREPTVSSPMAADTKALRDAVSGSPSAEAMNALFSNTLLCCGLRHFVAFLSRQLMEIYLPEMTEQNQNSTNKVWLSYGAATLGFRV